MVRCAIHSEPGKLVFRFRPFELSVALVVPVILGGFAYALLYGKDRRSMFAFIFFALIGAMLLHGWLWSIAGTEELEITVANLTHRRRILGFVRTKTYKVVEMSVPRFDVRPGSKGAVRTSIAFTYGGREIRLCESIQASEANDMMEAVLRHLPELSSAWGHYIEASPPPKGHTVLNLK
jgi:hypothetical protein